MRNHPHDAIVPARPSLPSTPRIPNRIHDAVHTPHASQHGTRNRPPKSRDRHGDNSRDVVLVEVLVGALGAVEGQERRFGGGRGRLDLFPRRVFEGVGDLGRFAEAADVGAVPGAHDEGRDGGKEDVAVGQCELGGWGN